MDVGRHGVLVDIVGLRRRAPSVVGQVLGHLSSHLGAQRLLARGRDKARGLGRPPNFFAG